MIDWDLWHSINELAATGSYKTAARRLGVNPTTIKRRKEMLEHKLGRHLFVRSSGQLVPTPACGLALEDVKKAAAHLEAARLGLGPDIDQGLWRKLTITAVPYLTERLLSPMLGRLPKYRRLRIELVGQDRNLDVAQGRDADIALRLGKATGEGLNCWHIADIDQATYVLRRVANDKLPWISLDRSYSHLKEVRLPEEHADEEGVRFTTGTVGSLMRVIESGAAKGLLPCFVGDANPNLVVLSDHPVLQRPVYLIWRQEAYDEPYFKAILTLIVQEAVSVLRSTEDAARLLNELES